MFFSRKSPEKLERARVTAAQALVYAECGSREAWKMLDGDALAVLWGDAGALAATVPFALARLCSQLADHHRTGVRAQVVHTLVLVGATRPEVVAGALYRLAHDESRKVQRLAQEALTDLNLAAHAYA